MGEDEVAVEVDRFLVVSRGGAEFGEDEVELGAVVVDVGILWVVRSGVFEVFGGCVARTCCGSISKLNSPSHAHADSLCSRCMLARLT